MLQQEVTKKNGPDITAGLELLTNSEKALIVTAPTVERAAALTCNALPPTLFVTPPSAV
jgi:hypothetical protein